MEVEKDTGQPGGLSSSTSSLPVSAVEAIMDKYRYNWLEYLGAQNKPLIPKDSFIPYSGPDSDQLTAACNELALRYQSITAEELNAILGLYCDREGCSFNTNWTKLLDILIPLRCTPDQLYNLFYAINTKFLPRNTSNGSICYQLMYLVLQYHDPKLSSHLDSHKVFVYEYAEFCFTAIFAGYFEKESVFAIWDKYFEKGDPFMLFSMCLVFLINLSEDILKENDKQQILNIISNAASNFSSKDVGDFFSIAEHFLEQTPPYLLYFEQFQKNFGTLSTSKDYQRAIFGSQNEGDLPIDISSLLALPVDARDLLGLTSDENKNKSEDFFKFFIIDARPNDQYSAGHVDGSYNLDSTLFVQAPDQYKIALTSLDGYRKASHPDDHLLFMGSGHEEEDSYVYMMVANFLHNGRKNIALVDGGYKAIHKLIAPNFERLDGHYEVLCKECLLKNPKVGTTTKKSSWKSKMDELISTVKSSAPAVGEKVWRIAQFPAAAAAVANNSKLLEHVDSSQRHGKRYRNQRSVFTLSDSDSDVEAATYDSPVAKDFEPKSLEDVLAPNEILEHFEGIELLSNGSSWRTVNCIVALTRTYMHVFHYADEKGKVFARSRHAYGTVLRVTSKKKIPEMLTFKFGYISGDECKVTAVQRFVLPKAGDCAKAIKMNIVNLNPGIIN
uniref:TBC1 domain family member 23 n=1 Tax=Syphacia muris TaxID=451379 RepID=A0A0N5AI33_9BILA